MRWLRMRRKRAEWQRLRADGLRLVHFLHIGKTGGTAVREALLPVQRSGGRHLLFHDHGVRLRHVPRGEQVVVFLRDPASRFVSGFNSRLRQGRPHYHRPWSKGEARAFARFRTAQELADALGSDDPPTLRAARDAMGAIQHVREHQVAWVGSVAALEARGDDILLVGHQETLSADFERLCALLGLPAGLRLPSDEVAAHRSPAGSSRGLAPEAAARIQAWYGDDLALIQHCRATFGPPSEG